jgi:hypothetical protein
MNLINEETEGERRYKGRQMNPAERIKKILDQPLSSDENFYVVFDVLQDYLGEASDLGVGEEKTAQILEALKIAAFAAREEYGDDDYRTEKMVEAAVAFKYAFNKVKEALDIFNDEVVSIGQDLMVTPDMTTDMPGFEGTLDNLNNLSIRKPNEDLNESIEKIKSNFKRFL